MAHQKTIHPLFTAIDTLLTRNNVVLTNKKIIIGLSGGPDSVFLFHYLTYRAAIDNITLYAAHIDHEWRINSHTDLLFCEQMARTHNTPFFAHTASQIAVPIKHNGSLEEKGRRIRRFFFTVLQQQENADYIALAHHADDQQETFFIRLARGTSLAGLCGMKLVDTPYLRPLLAVTKQEIVDYLTDHNIPFLTDPTNTENRFLRNKIRHQILPALRACDTRFNTAINRTMEQLQKTDSFLTQITAELFANCTVQHDTAIYLNIAAWRSYHPYMQDRIVLQWLIHTRVPFIPSQLLLDEIKRFLMQQGSGVHQLHTNWAIEKKKEMACIVHKTRERKEAIYSHAQSALY